MILPSLAKIVGRDILIIQSSFGHVQMTSMTLGIFDSPTLLFPEDRFQGWGGTGGTEFTSISSALFLELELNSNPDIQKFYCQELNYRNCNS